MFSPIPLEAWLGNCEHTCLPGGSAFDAFGGLIPQNRGLAKIRFVRHVASEGSVMSEDRVFDNRISRTNRLKECPQVWVHIVVIGPFERYGLGHGLVAQFRIVLFMPLLFVGFAHFVRETGVVVAGP